MKIKIIFAALLCIAFAFCMLSCADGEEFTVTFVTNCDTELEPISVNKGEKIPTPKALTKAGYTFDGWYVGEEKWVFAGYNVTEDITLEAKWLGNENTLVFDGNGAIYGAMMAMTIRNGETVSLPANGYARTGYAFAGWSTTRNGKVVYKNGAKYKMGANSKNTLYAVWEATESTLSFYADEGFGAMESIALATGETCTLPKCTFTREGYTFAGWTDYDGEVFYADGAEFTMGTKSSYTLIALWKANSYTITYVLNGGTQSSSNKLTYTVKDLPLRIVDAEGAEGKLFNFWYRESDFSGDPVLEITAPENITLYAEYVNGTEGLVFDGYGAVTRLNGSAEHIVIPTSYKGVKITKIKDMAFDNRDNIKSVTIPSSVTEIGYSAFFGCTELVSVTIAEGVKTIGESAFYGCKKISRLVIPSSVTSIGEGAFSSCSALETIVLSNSLKSIPENMLWDCESLKEITIPKSVESIGECAFYGCVSLTKIVIPSSVTSIDYAAFSHCENLSIYCEAPSQPNGWDSHWNNSYRPVQWNYKQ